MATARHPPLTRLQRLEAARRACHQKFLSWHARREAARDDANCYPAQSFERGECKRLMARARRAIEIYSRRHRRLVDAICAQLWGPGDAQ